MKRIASIGLLVLGAGTSVTMTCGSAFASGRERAADASVVVAGRTAAVAPASAVPSALPRVVVPAIENIDPALMDYFERSMNGMLEYGFVPPASLQLPPAPYPRPAVAVADLFLLANAAGLQIAQPPSDFRLLSSQVLCDGSEQITLEQTYASAVVDGTFLRFTVRGEAVTYVAARFVPDIVLVPVCPISGGSVVKELHYLPQTSSIIFVATIEQLGNGGDTVYLKDVCTDLVVGWTYRVKN